MKCSSRTTVVLAAFAGTFFCCLSANAQLAAGSTSNDGRTASEPSPIGISMYGVFAVITSMDEEQPGKGKDVIQHAIGIESDKSAQALAAYMKAAFYAGHASSSARTREFCQRQIVTREDLINALEERERDHNAALAQLAAGAADVVTKEEYAKLVQYAENHQSQRTLTSFDPRAAYADSNVDVASEVARRCDK